MQIYYRNLVFLGFILSAIYAFVFFVMRVFIAKSELGDFSLSPNAMEIFIVGFRFDMRVVCIIFAIFILLGFFSFINNAYGGGGRERK